MTAMIQDVLGAVASGLPLSDEAQEAAQRATQELTLLRDALALLRNEGALSALKASGYDTNALRLLGAVASESLKQDAMTADLKADIARRMAAKET